MIKPYELWIVLFVLIPVALLWAAYWKLFWRYKLTFLWVIGLSVLLSFAWDFAAVKLQIWFWPDSCCALPRILGLPTEEVLFFVFVSMYAICLTLILRERSKR